VTVLLIVTGMVSTEKMRHARPYIIVGAFIIAAFITPPDVISQVLLAVPMWLMFEGGLWFGARMVKNRDAEKAAEDVNDNQPTPPEGSTPASTTAAENRITTTAVAGVGAIASTTTSGTEEATHSAQSAAEVAHSTSTVSDAVLENALNNDDDFERAFAAIDMERAKLHTPLEPNQVADTPNTEMVQVDNKANPST
jgi:sec-independent protein translocase protein TatC